MQKRDFETYQKRFQVFEILPKFAETQVFRGTIRYPFLTGAKPLKDTPMHLVWAARPAKQPSQRREKEELFSR